MKITKKFMTEYVLTMFTEHPNLDVLSFLSQGSGDKQHNVAMQRLLLQYNKMALNYYLKGDDGERLKYWLKQYGSEMTLTVDALPDIFNIPVDVFQKYVDGARKKGLANLHNRLDKLVISVSNLVAVLAQDTYGMCAIDEDERHNYIYDILIEYCEAIVLFCDDVGKLTEFVAESSPHEDTYISKLMERYLFSAESPHEPYAAFRHLEMAYYIAKHHDIEFSDLIS